MLDKDLTVIEYRTYNWLSDEYRLWVMISQILQAGDLCCAVEETLIKLSPIVCEM